MKEVFPIDNREKDPGSCGCSEDQTDASCACEHNVKEEVCCGPQPAPPSDPNERPGYDLCRFVNRFIDTKIGPVPELKTALDMSDYIGTVAVRSNINRNDYKVSPGLYAVGNPDKQSPVLVTANYKLTFDTVRKSLSDLNLWVLVLDTRGVNVWCAAGKKTFGTEELVQRVKSVGLDQVVGHRKLILPQLGAVGVSGRLVKKECGFRVIWGPIQAADIKNFIENGFKTDAGMRSVTFKTVDRIILIPVEMRSVIKGYLWFLLAAFVLSGIGTDIFSFGSAWSRGFILSSACLMGVVTGVIAVPWLLPWIPGKAFSLKGTITGLVGSLLVALIFWGKVNLLEPVSMIFLCTAISSYLAMNFTGSTPYTSPSGVEKEMRRAMPLQAASLLVAGVSWVWAAFI